MHPPHEAAAAAASVADAATHHPCHSVQVATAEKTSYGSISRSAHAVAEAAGGRRGSLRQESSLRSVVAWFGVHRGCVVTRPAIVVRRSCICQWRSSEDGDGVCADTSGCHDVCNMEVWHALRVMRAHT